MNSRWFVLDRPILFTFPPSRFSPSDPLLGLPPANERGLQQGENCSIEGNDEQIHPPLFAHNYLQSASGCPHDCRSSRLAIHCGHHRLDRNAVAEHSLRPQLLSAANDFTGPSELKHFRLRLSSFDLFLKRRSFGVYIPKETSSQPLSSKIDLPAAP